MKERVEEVTRILNYERPDIQHATDLARIVYQKQDIQYIKELIKDLWEENQTLKKSNDIRTACYDSCEARNKELENKERIYREALEYIEFSTHFRCDVYNGKDCDPNTQEAYKESLLAIRKTVEQALNTEVK